MRTVQLEGVTLGAGPQKVIVPLTPTNENEAIAQAARATASTADIVEWRVDYLADSRIEAACHVAALLTTRVKQPLLATFRTGAEGGKDIDDDAYVHLLFALVASGSIDAVDVEFFHTNDDVVAHVMAHAHKSGVPVIGSYHDFDGTPSEEEIIERLKAMAAGGVDVAKLACMPHSPADVAALLAATYTASCTLDIPLLTMSMGTLGTVTRVAGGIFGSAATFAAIGAASAPGQVPVEELRPVLDSFERWQFMPQDREPADL